MLTFPLPYTFGVDEDITFATVSVVFESQKKQVQRRAINPARTWKISCKGNATDLQTLIDFQNSVGGNSSTFYFTDPYDVQQAVRFADPKLSLKVTREFTSGNTTHGTIVGFTADITIEKVL